ncbi:MFS transporter [Demequina lignilytica]|uniref:MFS transporter n=1 Tax=Demequina lignilytica TaxID=3051663 RepID=A0AB35MJG1_9MICO|nr:MFS transporter [Demequina sp. SYSU T0a273]MDN4483775.1 MFS transporter [Demequina sp. SYSU T0a273]
MTDTRTLELPQLGEILDRSPVPPERSALPHDLHHEPEPTTLAIPVVGGGEAVVLDEAPSATRTTASLTLTPRRAALALTALAAGAFVTGANEASVVALSPAIAAGLGVPVAQVGLLATAFALTVVLAAIPLTAVTGRLSRRLTLGTTLAVWTTGVVVAATAGSFAQLATGRVISAAAHALFWAIVAPTAASLFAPHLRGRSVTRIMLGAAAAGVVGTPVLTVAGDRLGWQAPYWGLAVLGAVLAVAFALLLPGPAPRDDDEDPADRPAPVRGDLPSRPDFLRVLAVTLTASVAMTTTWTYVVPFVTEVSGIPSATVPVMLALGGTVAVGATLAVGPFLARHAVPTVAVGLALLSGAWTMLALGQGWSGLMAQVLQAAGWAVLLSALLNWAMRHTPWPTDMGASIYTVTMNSGAALGPVVGSVLAARWGLWLLPLASLVLTLGAAAITATADRTMLRRLSVPSQLRRALAARQAVRDRRLEWQRRTAVRAHRPVAAAFAAGQAAARATERGTVRAASAVSDRAGRALRGHVADLDTHLG